ncbi:MAG TPA: VIT domain-containing protein [Phycisphaerae bacterium]|nr:VIT domain-containing protein [Phycisphaerae bacterium]HRW51468.1 VIT domain-containing protein [Phycisphaerae bacterium]
MRRIPKYAWVLAPLFAIPVLAISAILYTLACSSPYALRSSAPAGAGYYADAETAEQNYEDWDAEDYYASADAPASKSPFPIVNNELKLTPGAPSGVGAPLQRDVRARRSEVARGGRGRRGFISGQDDLRQKLAAYPGALPSQDEELWVIQKADADDSAGGRRGKGPCSGALLCKLPEQEETIPVPLEHTDVDASISAYIACVNVTQKFSNPYDQKIEAVYVFPLPQNAAVNEFLMTIGDRKIRGIIRDREEAKKIYDAAKRQGHVASLLTQERPNIFTQKVANIEPGKKIDINIKYFHTLAYDDGWYEFVFPMVVGPRYNPPGSTDGIGAVAVGARGKSGQSTEVEYLAPHQRSGHDVSLAVTIDAGVTVKQTKSVNHVAETRMDDQNRTIVKLSDRDSIPNKDFVLRYKVADDQINSALLTHRDATGGYFTLMIYPPETLRSLQRQPVELIFVLDCSGSMGGKPIEQAKSAIERGLKSLQPNDTFQIIQFSNNASQLGDAPVIASNENVRRGLKYLKSLKGEGGTQMIEGIKAALDFPHDEERLRFVCFMTDGYIGNETEILGAIHDKLDASRIFSFGVGSSPNRYLMNRMAKLGAGAVAYLSLNDSGASVMDGFFERISHPAMTDLKIDWGGMAVRDVFPERLPDLFVGRPVILSGRFDGQVPSRIRVSGAAGPQDRQIVINTSNAAGEHAGLAAVWARTKIADLVDRATWDIDRDISGDIRQLALNYNLMSQFTAFVAVDSLSRTAGTQGTTVRVPVAVPDGVRYETTVTE